MLSQTCRHGKIHLKYLAHLQHFILTSRIYNASSSPPPPSAFFYISNTCLTLTISSAFSLERLSERKPWNAQGHTSYYGNTKLLFTWGSPGVNSHPKSSLPPWHHWLTDHCSTFILEEMLSSKTIHLPKTTAQLSSSQVHFSTISALV